MRHDLVSHTIMASVGLSPLRNFGVLQPKRLFRSAQPEYSYEFNWMKDTLNLKHIVNLREESRIDDKFAANFGIKVHNFNIKDHDVPDGRQVIKFGHLIQDAYTKFEPLLFHCEHGHGRTSTFTVIARLALGWTLEEALSEEKYYFHYQFKHHHQEEFLRNLTPDLFLRA